MDIYKLLRAFWDYTFENTGKIKPNLVTLKRVIKYEQS